MLIFNVRNFHSRRIWNEKPAQENSRFSAPVSGACVMGITVYRTVSEWVP